MSTFLWRVTLLRNLNKLPKGLEVDVIIRNRTGRPGIEEIRKAIEEKYKLVLPSGASMSNFNCELK